MLGLAIELVHDVLNVLLGAVLAVGELRLDYGAGKACGVDCASLDL